MEKKIKFSAPGPMKLWTVTFTIPARVLVFRKPEHSWSDDLVLTLHPCDRLQVSVYSCIFCGALPSLWHNASVYAQNRFLPNVVCQGIRGAAQNGTITEIGHIRFRDLVDAEKSLNWRHHEIPGSQNIDGTGVLLCTIFYGGWGMTV